MVVELSKKIFEMLEKEAEFSEALSKIYINPNYWTDTCEAWFCLDWQHCDIWVRTDGNGYYTLYKVEKGEFPDFENPDELVSSITWYGKFHGSMYNAVVDLMQMNN